MKLRIAKLVGSMLLLVPLVASLSTPQQEQPNDETVRFALTGDSIITRRLMPYKEPAYEKILDVIRSADAAFTNFEMLLHDYEPYPASQSGGVWMRGDPVLAKDLAWAGFDLISVANNHTGDYGIEGI